MIDAIWRIEVRRARPGRALARRSASRSSVRWMSGAT